MADAASAAADELAAAHGAAAARESTLKAANHDLQAAAMRAAAARAQAVEAAAAAGTAPATERGKGFLCVLDCSMWHTCILAAITRTCALLLCPSCLVPSHRRQGVQLHHVFTLDLHI